MCRGLLCSLWIVVATSCIDVRAADPSSRHFPGGRTWPAGSTILFKSGDDPRWAAKTWDDSDWRIITDRELPSRNGIYWVRWRVTQPKRPLLSPADGMLFKVVASYDFYWDGRLIGRNGRVSSDPEGEEPGNVDALFQIPRDLLEPGEHVVALRMSSWNTGFPGATYGVYYELENFRELLVKRSRTAIFSVMAVGGALVVAIVFGLMWLLADRRRPLLLFSALFLAIAFMQALQASRWLFEYRYDWHYPRLVTITWLVMAIAMLLPAFVMHHFNIGRRAWVYTILALLLAGAWFATPFYNWISLYACEIGFIIALLLAIRAAWLRRRGAAFACAGLGLSVFALVSAPNDFLDHAFFISSGPAVLGLLIALALQLRDERRDAQRAVLAAARLETELLKKNIQPHFLINSLATIQEVIEKDPAAAVAMIDALASEFRILARVSGEKLITLAQELELCRAHLQVMSLRKGARCTLEVIGIDPTASVPPALFHTLIENGLTHLLPRNGKLEFELSAEHFGTGVRYIMRTRGQRQKPATDTLMNRVQTLSGPTRHPPLAPEGGPEPGTSAPEGTGLRYIKTRLEESFTGRWCLNAGAVPDGWETIIEITFARAAEFSIRAIPASGALTKEQTA